MGRGDRDYDNGSSSRRRDSKLSSTVEVPHRRHSTDRDSRRGSPRQGRRRTPSLSPPPSYSSDDHHRRNYSPVNNHRSRSHYEPDRRHKESHSNEFSNPRRSPRYDRHNESRSNEFSNPRRSPRYDRHNESRSNEFSNPRRSPGYDRHNESRSDEFLNPRRSPRYDRYERNDQYERNDRVNRSVPFLDREYKNGKVAESDSDEELKGLPYEEFRRLKRQKLRKRLRNCIWRITPSPPRSEWDEDRLEPPVEDFVDNEEKGSLGDEDRKERVDLDGSESSLSGTSSESESESEKDDSRSRRKRGSGRKGRRKSKSSRSRRQIKSESESESGSESGSESSELETRGSKKSTSKRARRGKRSKRRSKKIRKRSSDTASDESESEKSVSDKSDAEGSSDDNARSKKRKGSTLDSQSIKGKKKKHSGSVSENSDKSLSGSDIEGKTVGTVDELMKAEMNSEALAFKELLDLQKKAGLEAEDVVGPMPLPRAEGHISYGGALRPGEGDAIAQYVQQGKRIPRRGEVGLSADEIQRFEDLGYVMSGSRHQRMNAIRIRKENQVYSAEDKRALAMFNYEEKAKREHKVMADLQRLVQRHIGEDVGPTHDPFGGKATDDADT